MKSSTQPKPRGRRPLAGEERAARHAKILVAARTLFAAQGYASVSMRRLAEAAGMSPMSLYHYFANKRAILVHIWADIFETLLKDCRLRAAEAADPVSALVVYGSCFVQYWQENPQNYMMVYGEIDHPEQGESFFAQSRIIDAEFAKMAEMMAQAGVATPRLELACQQMLCAMHGVCHSLITIPEMQWAGREALLEGLIKGLIEQNKG